MVAPDQPVFREVLGHSGIFISPSDPDSAANAILNLVSEADWRVKTVAAAVENVARWNDLAARDRRRAEELFVTSLRDTLNETEARGAE